MLLGALAGCATSASARHTSAVSAPAASSSVISVPSLPFSPSTASDPTRVPAPQPDIGPSTGGAPRIDCSDTTVTASGYLDHGRGAVTVTLRPGAPMCALGGVASDVQLLDRTGNVVPARFVDLTQASTLDPPSYGYVRMGHDGPGTNEVTAVTFKLMWDGSYCGLPPARLLLFDSSWPGTTGTPITAALSPSSSPCGPTSGDGEQGAGTIVAYPAGGYPLPAPAWATLKASIRLIDTASTPPRLAVRLTNPTNQPVPLRPCFNYAIGIVATQDGGWFGEAFDGSPDCSKLPAALLPGSSIDLTIDPADVRPGPATGRSNGTLTWLMPGGPHVSVKLP